MKNSNEILYHTNFFHLEKKYILTNERWRLEIIYEGTDTERIIHEIKVEYR